MDFFFNAEGIQRLNFQHFKNDTYHKSSPLYDQRLKRTRHDFRISSLLLLNKRFKPTFRC